MTSMSDHHHHHDCGCEHHPTGAASDAAKPHQHHLPTRISRVLGPLAPIVACAVCPACLGTYAKILAALGVGICVSERQHRFLLAGAVALSLLLGARRARATRRYVPLAITMAGCSMLVGGHLGDVSPLEWAGVVALLAAGLAERRWEHTRLAPSR